MSQSRLWAITSYFNPSGFHSRRRNYHVFRERLGLPLVTVELASRRGFDLGPGDAEVLVPIRHGDVLWQKERLLNIALGHVPPECEAVAWIDCDVVFVRPDWARDVETALESTPVVQLFDSLVHLRPHELPEAAGEPLPEACRRSFASAWGACGLPDDFFRRPAASSECRCTCGMAWAARRDVLDRHGLYDGMVLGMGDKQVAAAAVGRVADAVTCMEMSDPHASHFRRWADGFTKDAGGRVGVVRGGLSHLWHGELMDRRYIERYRGFAAFQFDPESDLVRGPQGAWLWRRRGGDLSRHVAEYFRSRHEDGYASSPGTVPVAESAWQS